MKTLNKSLDRLSQMLKADKQNLSDSFLQQIKSDVFEVLNKYFCISIEDVKLDYLITNLSEYNILINLKSKRIKNMMFF